MTVSSPQGRVRAKKRTKLSKSARQQWWLAAVLVAPGVILIGMFVILPTLQTFQQSFYRWDGLSPDREFAGFEMYARAIDSLGFPQAVRNTFMWALIAVTIPPTLGLVSAALVEDSAIRPKALFRFAFFVPYFFSMAVAGAIFARVYDPSYGMLNRMLQEIGLGHIQPQWLGDQRLALLAAIVVFLWHETPFCYIVFTAAIQQIDRELYDAARVDGADGLQIFRNITVPSLSNIATFVMTVMLIGGLTPFAVVFALTTPGLGGPYYATEVLPTMIFKKGMQGYNAGEAAALGVILLLVVVLIAAVFVQVRERTSHSE